MITTQALLVILSLFVKSPNRSCLAAFIQKEEGSRRILTLDLYREEGCVQAQGSFSLAHCTVLQCLLCISQGFESGHLRGRGCPSQSGAPKASVAAPGLQPEPYTFHAGCTVVPYSSM